MIIEMVNILRPFALSVIDKFGKLKKQDFVHKLEMTYAEQIQDLSWYEANRMNISIFSDQIIENAVSDWLELQYVNYPHTTERKDNHVISGKVKSVCEISASSMYVFSIQNGWDLWRSSGMASGKKLQTVTLHDEDEPYYVVWGKDSIGIRNFNIVDFEWEKKAKYRIIIKNTLDGHGDGFGGSTSVTVNTIHYPSIRSAYARINPSVTYSTICTRLRNGLSPDDAFERPNMRANTDMNKLGVIVKKDYWIRNHKKIS